MKDCEGMDPRNLGAVAPLNAWPAGSSRVLNVRLAELRAQFPFLEIQPPPSQITAVFLAAAAERQIELPDHTQMIKFSASAAPFYVSFQGKASIPAAVNEIGQSALLVNPSGWYYVAGARQVSLIAPADTVVSLHCHVQQ